MTLPRPFDAEFLADMLYDETALFLDRIEELDEAASRIVCRMPTSAELPITRAQRVIGTQHVRHVSGGLMVHVTGMLGFAHAFHLEGLRSRDGWAGYGTHVHKAVYRKIATVDAPLMCSCTQTRVRRGSSRRFSTYRFEFRQQGDLVYESEQSAMWIRAAAPATDA